VTYINLARICLLLLLSSLLSTYQPTYANSTTISVAPTTLNVTLPSGQTATRTFSLQNTSNVSQTVRLSLASILPLATANASQPNWQPLANKITPALQQRIRRSSNGPIRFMVVLAEQADLSAAASISDWSARGRFVYQRLRTTAQTSQAGLLTELESLRQGGAVHQYEAFSIVNAVLVEGTTPLVNYLASRADVAMLDEVGVQSLPNVVPQTTLAATLGWGVEKIGAERVWSELGVRGSGVVVATMDSGATLNHAALSPSYRGTITGTHDFHWFDATNERSTQPVDANGHGTHVLGILVGDDGADNQVGVAPGAKWIAVRGCLLNSCDNADLVRGGEWLLAPYPLAGNPSQGNPDLRPHIVNNSWGDTPDNRWFEGVISAWRAAGILPFFSAGNTGCGQRVTAPGSYGLTIASGATSSSDTIASFSSCGPSLLTPRLKPDLSAPGVSVRSSWNDGGYRLLSGTSMASPHTAGCAALLLSDNPNLDRRLIHQILLDSALDLGATGPDFSFGYGRLNCYAALTAARAGRTSLNVPNAPIVLQPGETRELTLNVRATLLPPGRYLTQLQITDQISQTSSAVVVDILVEKGSVLTPDWMWRFPIIATN
jgi:subtilisin family serine protease